MKFLIINKKIWFLCTLKLFFVYIAQSSSSSENSPLKHNFLLSELADMSASLMQLWSCDLDFFIFIKKYQLFYIKVYIPYCNYKRVLIRFLLPVAVWLEKRGSFVPILK